jgi:hypothetical protein
VVFPRTRFSAEPVTGKVTSVSYSSAQDKGDYDYRTRKGILVPYVCVEGGGEGPDIINWGQ